MRVTTNRVRELRHGQTEAERRAWYLLRNRGVAGLKFHRQHPMGKYVVDFYCFRHRLAVELDGGAHSQPSQMQRDAAKDAYLKSLGIRVLRIPNGMVIEDPEAFKAKVSACVLPEK